MFRFGKSQEPSRIPEMLAIPQAEDLQFILSRAQRNWRTSIELPFRTMTTGASFTIVVRCEMGTGTPAWTLYRTDLPNSPVLWTHQSNDVLLIHNLISLEYTAASEKKVSDAPQEAAGASQAPPVQNPYLARLQESGKYGADQNAEQMESTPPAQTSAAQQPAAAAQTIAPQPAVPGPAAAPQTVTNPALSNPSSQERQPLEAEWPDTSLEGRHTHGPTGFFNESALSGQTQPANEREIQERPPLEVDWPDTSLEGSRKSDSYKEKKWITTSEQERVVLPGPEGSTNLADWSDQSDKPPQSVRPAAPPAPSRPDAEKTKSKLSMELKIGRTSLELSLSNADTGIFSYAAFTYFFENECVRFKRGGLPFSVLLIDMRGTNTTLAAETQREAGNRLRSIKRELDVFAHFKNDGYVFILPHTDGAGAITFAARVRQALTRPSLPAAEIGSVQISVGIATMPDHGITGEDILLYARNAQLSNRI